MCETKFFGYRWKIEFLLLSFVERFDQQNHFVQLIDNIQSIVDYNLVGQ